MKRKVQVLKLVALFLFVASTITAQQVFTLNGGYQSFPAQEAGTPGLPNGNVLVRKAPAPLGNINQIRQILNEATIPDDVIESRLTQGPLAGYITQMLAVISTANKLNERPQNAANISGAIIINSSASLNANRNRIRNNDNETFIFRGTVNVNEPIVVGSNKTFWIDGKVIYTGPERPLANTDALSPIPIIRDGVFRMVSKRNITIRGTKRGLVDCKSRIPFAYALNSREIKIIDNEVINGFNSIFMHQTRMVTIENNFLYNNVRRAMHIIAVNGYSIKNNLCYINHLDGIDIDAFAQNGDISLNVVVGVNFRFMLWTEIDAHDNILNNNVAIHLPGRKGRGVGGMQENGTENSRRGVGSFQGSRNNDWTNNSVFYPEKFRDGIVMRRDRFIQHNTIKFENNYVWSVEGNIQRHNPKPQAGNTSDVRFLTIENPAAGNKRNPTNLYPNGGPEVLINNSPDNLTDAAIKVTPGLFGGSIPSPTPAPTPAPTPIPTPTPNTSNNRFTIPGTIQAENFSNSKGSVRRENTPNTNGLNIGYIENGDYVNYLVKVPSAGVYTVNTLVSSNGVGGTIEFASNNRTIGTIDVSKNNNWHNYNSVATDLKLPAGNQTLRLNFKGGSGFLFNIDRLEIKPSVNLVDKTITLSPTQDAYLQNATSFNSNILRVEKGRRISYLRFDLRRVKGNISSAELELTVNGDAGNGIIEVYQGDNTTGWRETNLNNSNRPSTDTLLGSLNKKYLLNSTETFKLTNIKQRNYITLVVLMKQGNDVSFASKENGSNGPKLKITYKAPAKKLSDNFKPAEVVVSPNPTTNFIEIVIDNPSSIIESLSVFDIKGANMGTLSSLSGNTYDVSFLSNGIYIVKVSIKDNVSNTIKTKVIRIIKN